MPIVVINYYVNEIPGNLTHPEIKEMITTSVIMMSRVKVTRTIIIKTVTVTGMTIAFEMYESQLTLTEIFYFYTNWIKYIIKNQWRSFFWCLLFKDAIAFCISMIRHCENASCNSKLRSYIRAKKKKRRKKERKKKSEDSYWRIIQIKLQANNVFRIIKFITICWFVWTFSRLRLSKNTLDLDY